MAKTQKNKPRKRRITFMLNESEARALDNYCKRYKITNRSQLLRTTIMTTILKRFAQDTPTLFD